MYTFYIILNDHLIFFAFSIFKLMKKNFYFRSFFSLNCKEIPLKNEDFLSILNRNHHLKLKICFVSFPPKNKPHSTHHQFFPLSCLHFSTVACFYFILLLFVKVTVSISVAFKINTWPYKLNNIFCARFLFFFC